MSDIDETRLKAIEERANSATEGPWLRDTCSVITRAMDSRRHVDGGTYGIICETGEDDDCRSLDFIAHSRTDVVDLCAALRISRERERQLQSLLKEADSLLWQHHEMRYAAANFKGDCPVCSYNGAQKYPDNIFGRIEAALASGVVAAAQPADHIISERWALIDASGNPVKDTNGTTYEHPSREYLEKMYGDRGYRIGLMRTVVVEGAGENTQNERKD